MFESALDAAVCYARHMLTQGSVAAAQGVEVAGAEEGVEVVEEEEAARGEGAGWSRCWARWEAAEARWAG